MNPSIMYEKQTCHWLKTFNWVCLCICCKDIKIHWNNLLKMAISKKESEAISKKESDRVLIPNQFAVIEFTLGLLEVIIQA